MTPDTRRSRVRSRTWSAFVLWVLLEAAMPAQRVSVVAVTGTVQDSTGAVLPNAQVELKSAAGVTVQSTTTDRAGTFRLEFRRVGTIFRSHLKDSRRRRYTSPLPTARRHLRV